jgi:hypothetical protein
MIDDALPDFEQQPRFSQGDSALIKEIYELTHAASVENTPSVRLRLKELTAEAEKRKLL